MAINVVNHAKSERFTLICLKSKSVTTVTTLCLSCRYLLNIKSQHGQAKVHMGGDEKLIIYFAWPYTNIDVV